jgi:serpin B
MMDDCPDRRVRSTSATWKRKEEAMRGLLAVCLMAMLVAGCSPGVQSQQDQQPGQQAGTPNPFTHVTTVDTEYYLDGPQQGRPADGRFAAGTPVVILQEGGSYTRVRSQDGIEAWIVADAVARPLASDIDVSDVVAGGNRFAFDLYQKLRSQPGNLFFSPASISTALAMTYAGAAGSTAAEMADTLHFPPETDSLHLAMQTMQQSWNSADPDAGVQLSVANRLWGAESYSFLPAFLRTTRNQYDAQLARLDFGESETARQTINNWVQTQTREKIGDLIPPGAISPDTMLVLTNAIYFYGQWSTAFSREATSESDFYLTAGNVVRVPMMFRTDRLRYGEAPGYQLLELPYGNGSFSMVVLLPRERDGLNRLEDQLTAEFWQQAVSLLNERQVQVHLPRFRTKFQFEMTDALQSLGMTTAFVAGEADFSGMTGDRNLFISTALHKAFVEVNEKGTEAAAASGVVVEKVSLEAAREPVLFRADHPFLFAIRDNRTDAILFIGRVANPQQ